MDTDTPMSTRTQHSKAREVRQQFWTAERRANKMEPSDEEMDRACRAAVCISAYDAERGRKSVWPSSCDLVEFEYGYDLPGRGKTPVSASEVPQDEFYRQVKTLKLSLALRDRFDDAIDSGATEAVSVECPVCGDNTMTAEVGTHPAWTGGGLEPKSEPRMVGLTVDCTCDFDPSHYEEVEDEAVERYQG